MKARIYSFDFFNPRVATVKHLLCLCVFVGGGRIEHLIQFKIQTHLKQHE